MSTITLIEQHKTFNGLLSQYQHLSKSNQSVMTFSIYLPEKATQGAKVPVLYWLSGLTCTDQNFSTKAGAFQYADQYGYAIVIPDTSPRGKDVADDKKISLGQGASFYVNASQAPWAKNYQMYDYIVSELPQLIEDNFPVSTIKSIFGHSMGGYGALMIGLRNAEQYQSISVFAPAFNATLTSWAKESFTAYLGPNQDTWKVYNCIENLSLATRKIPILIHQGDKDPFYPDEIQPEFFVTKARELDYSIEYQLVAGYDHSYYFISTFIGEHFKFHSHYLTA